MNDYMETIGESGLHCFGAVSASISHELKNALAIINENAGLLEDLSLMAGKGLPLDPDRLKNLARNIAKQIQRADGIIRSMNHFAHSVDETISTVDLADTLSLTVAVSSRMAAMKGISLSVIPPDPALSITTRLFFFQNLLWLCLKEIMERPIAEKEITLTAVQQDNGIAVVFSPVDAPMTDSRTIDLLGYLKAMQSVSKKLSILLPSDITNCFVS